MIDVVIVAGQSNAMQSDAAAVAPDVDADGAVTVWEDGVARPLRAEETSLGPEFGRVFVRRFPERRVLLVPAAEGSTGFLTSSLVPPPSGYKPGPGAWDRRLVADPENLVVRLLTRVAEALAAVPDARLSAVLWSQGESDCTRIRPFLDRAQYARRLDDLIAYLRARWGAPELPFLIGGMVPEWVSDVPERLAVLNALETTPTRVPHTAYIPGPVGMPKAGEEIHWSTAAQRVRALEMAGAGWDQATRAADV